MSSLNSNLDSFQLSFLKMALGESVFPIPRQPSVWEPRVAQPGQVKKFSTCWAGCPA